MRRTLVVAIAVLALLGALAPPVFAQAPAPKVTIEGLIDQTSTWERNVSVYDVDLVNDKDDQWYARTRGNFQITGEIAKVKVVTLIQTDLNWGSARGNAYGGGDHGGPFGRLDGSLNTEIIGALEIVELWTEFPLSGEGSLLPFVPVPGTARAGFQNFDVDFYKPATLAWGWYGGVHLDVDVMPGAKATFTYAQLEDSITGGTDGFTRGDDFAMIFGLAMSPMKGLDVKPIYAYYYADGTTTAFAGPRMNNAGGGGPGAVADTATNFPRGAEENRHTFGADARWKSGAWSVDPTAYYQWGSRDIVPSTPQGRPKNRCGARCVEQKEDAWFFDVRGGWLSGPLNLEGMFAYVTGNSADEDIRSGRPIHYYQPLVTNAVYGVTWGHIVAITADYLTQLNYSQPTLFPGAGISYDKYGRVQFGAKATYSVTPAFSLRGVLVSLWTAEDVDTLSTTSAAANTAALTPTRVGAASRGNDNYIGTEFDVGFAWNFAPGISLNWVYGHLFAGDALGNANALTAGGANTRRDPKDVDSMTTMLRYIF